MYILWLFHLFDWETTYKCTVSRYVLGASFTYILAWLISCLIFFTDSLCQLDGWQFYNGSCYLMVSQSNEYLRWNEASSYCKAPGREAHLVSIGR